MFPPYIRQMILLGIDRWCPTGHCYDPVFHFLLSTLSRMQQLCGDKLKKKWGGGNNETRAGESIGMHQIHIVHMEEALKRYLFGEWWYYILPLNFLVFGGILTKVRRKSLECLMWLAQHTIENRWRDFFLPAILHLFKQGKCLLIPTGSCSCPDHITYDNHTV